MNQTFSRRSTTVVAAALVAFASSCTMKNQETPPLTGPSELGTSINVAVTPDLLTQDGGSQALVTVTAYDSNGKPLRSVSLRSEIFVGGVIADFGTLSARSIVTGSDGRATLIYTAPGAPAGPSVDLGTTVNIAVTPLGYDYANSVTRFATIRLVPSGIVVPPDGLQPAFTFNPIDPTDHQNVFFDGSGSRAPGTNPIALYTWDFGDGRSATGVTATHSYNSPGTFVVKLTISDSFSRAASTSQVVTVAAGALPFAQFTVSPISPKAGEQVNFNASGSRAAPGRTIRTYQWDFGDGEQKTTTTPLTTHDYAKVGSFTVTLTVTDDAGRTEVSTGTVFVQNDLVAAFTISPTDPVAGVTTVNFNGSSSTAAAGRTIASYSWDFGDGRTRTTSNPLTTNIYAAAGSYNVTLTITDDSGKSSIPVTKSLTVK
jgi:PKD repeat protein